MIATNKKAEKIDLCVKAAVTFLFLLLAFSAGRMRVQAAAAGANIRVCVDPPEVDLTDPTSPKINFETQNNPFFYYQLTISRDSILSVVVYDSGIQMYGSGANPPGTYEIAVPKGQLLIDDTTYYYAVRVRDAYDWSPYAQGEFVLRGTKTECSSMTLRDGTKSDQASREGLEALTNIFRDLFSLGGSVKPACWESQVHEVSDLTPLQFHSGLFRMNLEEG